MAKRNARKRDYHTLGLFLIIVGTLFVAVSTAHNLLRLRSLRLDRATVQAYVDTRAEANKEADIYPTHIYIQWFLDVDIEPAVYQSGSWTISPNKASYLLSSGRVGKGGNIILYGHNKRSIVGNIRALKGGEKISLTASDGSVHEYQVISRQEVTPTDTRLIQPTQEEVLTLYTCSGLLDSQRFVVQAKPISR